MNILEGLPKGIEASEEIELVKIIRKTKCNNKKAMEELVLGSMREAFLYSKRVSHGLIPDDELYSMCYTVLMRNARRFRPGHGIRFFAFAKIAIRGATKHYWTQQNVVRNSESEFSIDFHHGGRPKFPVDEPANINSLTEQNDVVEVHPDIDRAVDPDFGAIHVREMMETVDPIIRSKLTPQEGMIIDLHYRSGFNFQKIGELLGVSRSAAQSSHAHALKKIRCELFSRGRLLDI